MYIGKWARGCFTKGGFKMIFLGGCESGSAPSDPSEPIIFKLPLVKRPLVPFPICISISIYIYTYYNTIACYNPPEKV